MVVTGTGKTKEKHLRAMQKKYIKHSPKEHNWCAAAIEAEACSLMGDSQHTAVHSCGRKTYHITSWSHFPSPPFCFRQRLLISRRSALCILTSTSQARSATEGPESPGQQTALPAELFHEEALWLARKQTETKARQGVKEFLCKQYNAGLYRSQGQQKNHTNSVGLASFLDSVVGFYW